MFLSPRLTKERTATEMAETQKNIRTINIAILGLGTVGGGVYKLIERQKESFAKKIGCHLAVKKILVRNINKTREGVDASLLTDNFDEIINDSDIDMVVELMGGIHPAKEYVLQALAAGKQVVTANKDLIAAHGEEVFAAAAKNNLDFKFEAAVAGGIPVIAPLMKSLAVNNIEEIIGIVNGTTNFILTKMASEGMEFGDALAEATRLGYAEADPTADIEGYDAARKCAILSTLAFHSWVTDKNVITEGITRITAADIHYAKEMGYVIKLLAIAREVDGEIVSSVYPALIPGTHPLATVNDSFNAVFIRGDAVGDTMFYGRGAGEFPTASAVMGDIMEVASDILKDSCGSVGEVCYRKLPIKSQSEIRNRFFLRMQVEDKPGVMAAIANIFSINNVSMKQLLQKSMGENEAELMIVTEKVKEQNFRNALRLLTEMEIIKGVSNVIRVHGLR